MSNEPFYAPNQQPPRQRTPGELLFTFGRGIDIYAYELRGHGEFGIEAQILSWQMRDAPVRALAAYFANRRVLHRGRKSLRRARVCMSFGADRYRGGRR